MAYAAASQQPGGGQVGLGLIRVRVRGRLGVGVASLHAEQRKRQAILAHRTAGVQRQVNDGHVAHRHLVRVKSDR